MSLQYNTDARIEGRRRARSERMDRNGSEQAQYAWISVRERGVYRKKPQLRTWEFYMKPGNTLRAIESSQGCWNERRAGCATMKPLRFSILAGEIRRNPVGAWACPALAWQYTVFGRGKPTPLRDSPSRTESRLCFAATGFSKPERLPSLRTAASCCTQNCFMLGSTV